ncbi:MAG: GGDEF domain-containing protein [Gammaproteobacteria bacterium]|nr:GGDEF domain-containing protein [Gammaproteobacteria bacterium]
MKNHRPQIDEDVQRKAALDAFGILGTLPEERFDRYTRLTRRLLNVPVARVSLTAASALTGTTADDTPLIDDPNVRFYAGCPLNAPDGRRLGTLSVIDSKPRALNNSDMDALRDIAAMVSSELSSLQLANIDELTGLANRRAFYMIADQCLRMCARDRRQAALLMIDLDDFKLINDTMGHADGDKALVDFAQTLRNTFRHSDVIARLGGDEFCVLLTDTGLDNAWQCVERLRNDVNEKNLLAKRPHGLKFSVGVIQWERDRHPCVADLLREADRLMYTRKRAKQQPGKATLSDQPRKGPQEVMHGGEQKLPA